MSDDDYLSDTFLVETPHSTAPKTYSALRKEAKRKAQWRHEQNKTKGVRQRELEARESGLSKSLFERAREEEEAGLQSSKALSIMMKMGFKPGQALGGVDNKEDKSESSHPASIQEAKNLARSSRANDIEDSSSDFHQTQPLPLNEWQGRKGIGVGKRTRSPGTAERAAKLAKMAEAADNASKSDFRERTKRDYEARQAESTLGPAQRTCATLDEGHGITYNVLWLNLSKPEAFPAGLLDALKLHPGTPASVPSNSTQSQADKLRHNMQKDALQPLPDSDDEGPENASESFADSFSHDTLEEAREFLRLPVSL
ncbi:hypothetical protein AX16_000185 [Volvariella volvacea WC 439]|nr:hypothetical protein AX16_000185 [Volvariella volvacea WC 439]